MNNVPPLIKIQQNQQYYIQAGNWRVKDVLKKIKPENILLSAEKREKYEPIFWDSICTEYDARRLYEKLFITLPDLSTEFQFFLVRYSINFV